MISGPFESTRSRTRALTEIFTVTARRTTGVRPVSVDVGAGALTSFDEVLSAMDLTI